MHSAQNYSRPCLVHAAREVGRNTQMTSNSMHRFFVTTCFPEAMSICRRWTVPTRDGRLRPDSLRLPLDSQQNWHLPAMDGASQGVRSPPRCEWVHVLEGFVSVIEKIKKKHNHNKHDVHKAAASEASKKQLHCNRICTIRCGSISMRKNTSG